MRTHGAEAVVITPEYDCDSPTATITVHGLKEGSHLVISVPGIGAEQYIFIGKRGAIHTFGFGLDSCNGEVRIGPEPATDHSTDRFPSEQS